MIMHTHGFPERAPQRRLLTPQDAAAYLGISERSLWNFMNRGEIPHVRFGPGRRKSVRYDLFDLDHWIDARRSRLGHRAKRSEVPEVTGERSDDPR